MSKSGSRVGMLDILRGIAVIGMVIHHAMVCTEIVFDTEFDILYTDAFHILQLVFVCVFLLVSGICTNYSRNVLKRGIIVFAAAMLVTFATCVVMPAIGIHGLNIYFGILHMFGLSMIIYALLAKRLDKINSLVGALLFAALFFAYYSFYLTEPSSEFLFLLPFGIMPESITAYGDYYPLFPYMFMFLSGTFIGRFVKCGKFPEWFYNARCKPLEFCGKYSLWVYILHQPVIFGILNIFLLIKG